MEGEKVLASMDSLWFYSSVFLPRPSSKHKQSECPDKPKPKQQQDAAETHGTSSASSCQASRSVKEETVVATGRRAALRSRKESKERVGVWLKKQRRPTKVVAMPARCSPMPMPPPDDGIAMKAHLRSWAHAVACSAVR